ncbi:ATP-binding protein, partial [Stenotrophomonas sp. A3_2]|uniref:ATP-binding protein n=1 Tax=Stenotrophomonas sp. A3_2 TaxID=3119978 RepID=UPI002FC3BE10
DLAQLELVLLNLAINARDAMPQGGEIVIAAANTRRAAPRRAEEPPEGDHVALGLRDTGGGMTPEVAARAFEPFFTTKPVGQGSGLGLAQVLGVAQQLGGGVTLETAAGCGTTLTVFLPR